MSRATIHAAIPEGDRILLDTTVLAAYLDATDATHPVAVHVLDEMVAAGRNPAVVSMITVMEILVRPMRAVPPGHFTVLSFLRSHPNLACVPVDLQVAQEAAHLRADRRLSPPDALIVGTGIAAQVGHLVTNDRAWTARLAPMAPRLAVLQVGSHLPFTQATLPMADPQFAHLAELFDAYGIAPDEERIRYYRALWELES